MKYLVMALFALFSSFSAMPTVGANPAAEEAPSCNQMKRSLSAISTQDIEKCHDLQTQKVQIFVSEGAGSDFGGCLAARSRASAKGWNVCREHAVKNGLDAKACTRLALFQTSDGYACSYTSMFYLKDSSSAFIAFTLDSATQQSLFREAQSRSLSVRELIAEKLKK